MLISSVNLLYFLITGIAVFADPHSFNSSINLINFFSILLAICLPKLTFYLRKLVTGSDAEPGLVK